MEQKIVILGLFFGIVGFCLADPAIPDLDDFEALKDRCDKKAGNGTFEKIKAARMETQTCIENLISIDAFKTELEVSRQSGSMDEVFNKYCKKIPKFRACIKKTYDALEPCLEEKEKNAVNFTSNIVQQLGEFACFKNGDRLAMFVAEGGADCLKSRSEGIQNCVNETIKFNPETFSANSIPNLVVDKRVCDDLVKIQTCVVKDMENCPKSTPANLIDALFKFVKKIACKDVVKRSILFM
ncbi:unnamed protein product [Phyllotreta striolata]|uniref:Uncharacterized protein n=1 Tax=Phyllotreta striolata TaxID=444603 RepID=A0A9N9TKR3_PHYSR|nr:unnamed protein product [Phyllotreta striolata]